MARHEYTENDYYDMLSERPLDYGEYAPVIDSVASMIEWKRCKAAILRWVAEQDAEYDSLAEQQEHELDDDE